MDEHTAKIPLKEMLTRLEDYTNFAISPAVSERDKQFYKGAASAIHDLLCICGHGNLSDHFIDILNGEENPTPLPPEFAEILAGPEIMEKLQPAEETDFVFQTWNDAAAQILENYDRDFEEDANREDPWNVEENWDTIENNIRDTLADWCDDVAEYQPDGSDEEAYQTALANALAGVKESAAVWLLGVSCQISNEDTELVDYIRDFWKVGGSKDETPPFEEIANYISGNRHLKHIQQMAEGATLWYTGKTAEDFLSYEGG